MRISTVLPAHSQTGSYDELPEAATLQTAASGGLYSANCMAPN